MIFLEIIWYGICTIGIGFAIVMIFLQIKELILDWNIYKKGHKYNGKCIGKVRRGKINCLQIKWKSNDLEHYDEWEAIAKSHHYPHQVDVYTYHNHANLGVFTIIKDALYLFAFNIILVCGIACFFV